MSSKRSDKNDSLPPDSGGELLFLPDYQYYFPTQQVQQILQTIAQTPGYHLIAASVGMGKTALAVYMWREFHSTRPVVLQLFSREYGITSVEKALHSVCSQIIKRLRLRSTQNYQGKDIGETFVNLLQVATERKIQLFIVLDGIDETEIGERRRYLSQLLPNLDTADRFGRHIFVVITRSDVKTNVLSYIQQSNHPLHQVVEHTLDVFTPPDVEAFVNERNIPNAASIAQRIFELSDGHPFVVHELSKIACENADDLADFDARSDIPAVERLWEYNLRNLEQSQPAESLLHELIPLLAVARAGLPADDIATLTNAEARMIQQVLDACGRYFPKRDDAYSLLIERFRWYIARQDRYRHAVADARERLLTWIRFHIGAIGLNDIPLYVLHFSAEHLAGNSELPLLLARRDWFRELENRLGTRAGCQHAVLRTFQAIDEPDQRAADATRAVNVIACAVMLTCLKARLLPELVLKLVELKLWTKKDALIYASLYESQSERESVEQALTTRAARPTLPDAPELRRALDQLRALAQSRQSRERKRPAVSEWLRRWERVGAGSDAQEKELLEHVQVAFEQPARDVEFGAPDVSPFDLLFELETYLPAPTGIINDQHFLKLITDMCDAWIALDQPETAFEVLSRALRLLSSYSRAELLYALEIIAPAIVHYFPKAVPDIRTTITQLVQAHR